MITVQFRPLAVRELDLALQAIAESGFEEYDDGDILEMLYCTPFERCRVECDEDMARALRSEFENRKDIILGNDEPWQLTPQERKQRSATLSALNHALRQLPKE